MGKLSLSVPFWSASRSEMSLHPSNNISQTAKTLTSLEYYWANSMGLDSDSAPVNTYRVHQKKVK